MPDGNKQYDALDIPTRRKILKASAIGMTLPIAGCGGNGAGDGGGDGAGDGSGDGAGDGSGDGAGDGGGDGDGTPTEGGMEMVDRTLRVGHDNPAPTDQQFNPMNPAGYGWKIPGFVFSWLTQYSTASEDFRYDLLEDVSFTESEVSLTIHDNYTWHDGNAVTADDLITRLKLADIAGNSLWNYLDGVQKANETTVKGTLASKVNQKVFLNLLGNLQMSTPAKTFDKFVQSYADATSEDERNQVKSNLTGMTLDEPVGSGPFQYDSADSKGTYLTRFEDHPHADKINFPDVELVYVGERANKLWALMIEGKLDWQSREVPGNILKQVPDHYTEMRIRNYADISLLFNYGDDLLGRRKVRQAVCYIFNRKLAVKNGGQPNKIHMDFPMGGMFGTAEYQKSWIGDLHGKLTRYKPNEEGKQTAAQLLRDEGFSKQDGTWMTPNGEPWTPSVYAPACCNAWQAMMQTAASNLQDFGVKAEFKAVNTTKLLGTMQPNGDFQIGTALPGGLPHPFFNYQGWFPAVGGKTSGNYDTGAPDKVEVPMPVGDPEGSVEKVSWREPLNTLGTASGEEAQKAVRKLAWIFNQNLPGYPATDKFQQAFMNRQGWTYPPRDHPDMRVAGIEAPQWIPHKGLVQADPDESLSGGR